jgi:hypothetical protein
MIFRKNNIKTKRTLKSEMGGIANRLTPRASARRSANCGAVPATSASKGAVSLERNKKRLSPLSRLRASKASMASTTEAAVELMLCGEKNTPNTPQHNSKANKDDVVQCGFDSV